MDATSGWTGYEPFLGVFLLGMTIWTCVAFWRKKVWTSFLPLAIGHIIFAMSFLVSAVGEVEKYSQASALDFYIERQGEDCYVQPAYYKSYAQYFYTDRQPQNTCEDFDWLSRGPIDKPVYFVIKDEPWSIEKIQEDVPDAQFLERKPGFRFYVRYPSKPEE